MRATAVCGLVGLLTACASAAAAESLGRVEARIAQAERSWHTITIERSSGVQASATARFGPRLTEIQVQGYPDPAFTSRDAFSIEIRFAAPYDPALEPMSVDLLYTPEGLRGPFWTSRGAPDVPVLRILTLETWGAVGTLDALFAGALCYREKISAATDPDTCREVTGRIRTELFVSYGAPRADRARPRPERRGPAGGGAGAGRP